MLFHIGTVLVSLGALGVLLPLIGKLRAGVKQEVLLPEAGTNPEQ
jgi:hypothetical protein